MNNSIKVINLKKNYGKIEAVKGISFNVKKGQLFAFLGPNGAGKSTTIDILCTLSKFDSGEVYIENFKVGKDDNKIKKLIGIVFQDNMLDKKLTVKENLKIRAQFYFKSRVKIKDSIERVSNVTNLKDFINQKYENLSGGQRRRVDIARALLNLPNILFLDEPTTGLDPQTRKSIWELLEKLQNENNMTIFLTTHYMEEADRSNFVVIIDNGKIVAEGTPLSLKERYSSDHIKIKPFSNRFNDFGNELKNSNVNYFIDKEFYDIKVKNSFESLHIIKNYRDYIENFEILNGTMDDAFLNITGKEIRE